MKHLLCSFVWCGPLLLMSVATIVGCPGTGQDVTARIDALEVALAVTQAGLSSTQQDLATARADLQTAQADLAVAVGKLANIKIVEGTMDDLLGPHLIFEGCNVHIRSGSGDTEDRAGLTGSGNLIIGYNELPIDIVTSRLGSHNLIVGKGHGYSHYGGIVAGERNALVGAACSVIGGEFNTASGEFASVSGGSDNVASGISRSVCGGAGNEAEGRSASVCGGESNRAQGESSTVSGGFTNRAEGFLSSVTGGNENVASGFASSVSGGKLRTATDDDDWVAGSLTEDL